jgi:hypothetical protein
MIEGLPWPASVGITGSGWLLAASIAWLVIRKLIDGDLVTRREADDHRDRAVKAEDANEKLVDQNAQLMDMARLGTATMQALKAAAGGDDDAAH